MKNCIKCSHPLEEGAKFCPECGTKQPDLPKIEEKEGYTASIGDKNVISGNIVGKNEEYKISGNANFTKIEDDTKKFIKCAVSGRHLLRGRDNIVTCPKCNSDVAHDCFNNNASRCFNCDKVAHESYYKRVEHFLVDGLLDSSERIELDSLALSLVIDKETKISIEENVRQNLIKSKNAGVERELSGFHKIQFKKALKSIYEDDMLSLGLETLLSIHKNNIQNDEIASHYYLVKAIVQPDDYIVAYQNKHKRAVDVYWEDYWAFLPYIKSNRNEDADDIVSANKARFSDRKNDILISEVIFHYLTFIKTQDTDYLELAKEIYSNFGKSVKPPLIPIVQLLDKLLSGDTDSNNLDAAEDSKEVFYMKYLFISNLKVKKALVRTAEKITATHSQTKAIKNTQEENAEYSGVKIGEQIWMTRNLDETTFRNGDTIPEAKSKEEWIKAGHEAKPAWCCYDNNEVNGKKYGKLYNWYAVNDPRGLAPEGCFIPSDKDVTGLMKFLGANFDEYGNYSVPSKIIKSVLKEYNNSTGFSALYSGQRNSEGEFSDIGEFTQWWTSTENVYTDSFNNETFEVNDGITFLLEESDESSMEKSNGFPIRCLRQRNIKELENDISKQKKSGVNDADFFQGEKVISKSTFQFDYEGANVEVSQGEILCISSVKATKQIMSFKEFPQINKNNPKTWFPFEKFNKLDQLPKLSIGNFNLGDSVICVSNSEVDQGFNDLLVFGNIYTVNEIKGNKGLISLAEFPQQNRAEKIKWFSMSNFRSGVLSTKKVNGMNTDDYQFLMPIERVFSITGLGTFVVGIIEKGIICTRDPVNIIGMGAEKLKSLVTVVQKGRKTVDEGKAGEEVALSLRGISKNDIKKGMLVVVQ